MRCPLRTAPTLPDTTRTRLPSATPTCCDRQAAVATHLRSNQVRSARGALPALPLVGFPEPPPEPGVHRKAHRALRKPRGVVGYLMWCSAMVLGCVFPGSSSA
jgi:hypothetical protein